MVTVTINSVTAMQRQRKAKNTNQLATGVAKACNGGIGNGNGRYDSDGNGWHDRDTIAKMMDGVMVIQWQQKAQW